MNAQLSTRSDSRIEHLRIPPHDISAEQAVLGALMLAACAGVEAQERAWADVADILAAEDFHRHDHQLIFTAIRERHATQAPFDPIVLGEWFASQGLSGEVAGGAYLSELCSSTASAANIKAYASIVRDKSLLRQLIDVGSGIVGAGFDPDGRSAEDVVAKSAAQVAALTQRATTAGLRPIHSTVDEAWNEIVARDAGEITVGLTPPWANVRHKLPGLEDTDLCVIAGRPGMGKTVTGLEFADHAAEQGRNVAIFSLEMSAKQLTTRMISRRARVDAQNMRMQGGMSDDEWREVSRARSEVRALPIAIDDSGNLTIDALCARATRMHAKVKGGLGLVMIDYLQLIDGTGKEDRRHDEIARISRRLKQLAKDLRCPVLALSQLNRSVEARTDKRPTMSDLRESGAIEQDADVICFIYRDDYYTKDACGAPGVAEFIIGKQRNGPTGVAYLSHHLECSRFDDYHGPKPVYAKRFSKGGSDGFDDDDIPRGGRDRAAGDA